MFAYGGDPEEAALRRATLRFFLDLSAMTDGLPVDQDTFRRLITSATWVTGCGTCLGPKWRAPPGGGGSTRRAEYYSLALNRLWALLSAWGAERSAPGRCRSRLADWWTGWTAPGLRPSRPGTRRRGPGICSSAPLADLADWVTAAAGTGANVDDIWPQDSALTEDRLSAGTPTPPETPGWQQR